MKLGPLTKLHKKKHGNVSMTPCQQIVTPLLLFQFMANLELTGIRILYAWSVKLTFSLIVTFYLTKSANKSKNFLTQLSYFYIEWNYYFWRKMLISCKKMLANASKIKRVLVLNGISSGTAYVPLRTHQISYF